MKQTPWREGNQLTLLENGEDYYPDLFAAIDAARQEILLETFILFDDPVGRDLCQRLAQAARRGCRVELTVDGYGSAELPERLVTELTGAGVGLHSYDPKPTVLGLRTNLFRRLHRKLVVIDRAIGYIGGINFSIEHLRVAGDISKQDYALRVTGPVVADMHALMEELLQARRIPAAQSWLGRWRARLTQLATLAPTPAGGSGRAVLVTRDNDTHRRDIELVYRMAIRNARSEIIIANAYFLPGFRFLQELRHAARRGVDVQLIMQGNADWPLLQAATKGLYDYLTRAGVVVHEYCRRPMHGKVAVIDGSWSTVGSSNLDPLSLFLNLEANLVVVDPALGASLRGSLQRLIKADCARFEPEHGSPITLWRRSLSFVLFHFLRRFPYWSGWLPGHAARLQVVAPDAQ